MKSQHERIEIISNTSVIVRLVAEANPIRLDVTSNGGLDFVVGVPIKVSDHIGREALRLATECFDQHGSFEGLSADNAIPFAGKEGRVNASGWWQGIWKVVHVNEHGSLQIVQNGSGEQAGICAADFRPLEPPAKKYRPIASYAEAEPFIDVVLQRTDKTTHRVYGASRTGLILASGSITFDCALAQYTVGDSGEPCGVLIEE
jgi:hypothetical protein